MDSLALVAAALIAGTLLRAGLEKARSLDRFASVLRQLGVPARSAHAAATVITALELGTAGVLLYRPSTATLAMVLALVAAFATSGLVALRRGARIRCACFGPDGGRHLGMPQLVALPFWIGGVALVWLDGTLLHAGTPGWLPPAVALAIASIRGIDAARAAIDARADRRSARRMLAWLTR